jgi:hypothetical protein
LKRKGGERQCAKGEDKRRRRVAKGKEERRKQESKEGKENDRQRTEVSNVAVCVEVMLHSRVVLRLEHTLSFFVHSRFKGKDIALATFCRLPQAFHLGQSVGNVGLSEEWQDDARLWVAVELWEREKSVPKVGERKEKRAHLSLVDNGIRLDADDTFVVVELHWSNVCAQQCQHSLSRMLLRDRGGKKAHSDEGSQA